MGALMELSPQEFESRLNQYIMLLNEHGPEGEESKKFVESQTDHTELLKALESVRELAVAHGVGALGEAPTLPKRVEGEHPVPP